MLLHFGLLSETLVAVRTWIYIYLYAVPDAALFISVNFALENIFPEVIEKQP